MPKNVILRCVALCSVLTTIPLLGCGSATRAGAELEGVATTPSAFITAAGDIAFNFDDGTTQGWTVAWGSAFDPAKASVENTTALARGTNPGALAVNVAYTGAGFEEANVQALLQAGGAKLDLSAFSSLEYDVFIPNPSQFTGTLKVETALSADFAEVGTFSDVNVAALPQQTINGAAYAQLHVKVGHDLLADKNRSSLLVIRLAAGGSTYHGPLYIDDVHLTKVVVPLGSGAVVWDFEDGTTQGWAQAWGSAFDPSKPAVQNSAAIASAGDAGALAVNVAYKGGGFEEANVAASINGSGVKVDLGAFERLTYDVYVPNPQNFTGTLKLLTALNDPYGELTAFQDYSPASMPQETINGVSYVVIHRVVSNDALSTHPPSSQLVVRLAASASTYVGPIYIDNVVLAPLAHPSLTFVAPTALDTVSGVVTVRARLITPPNTVTHAVTLTTPGGASIPLSVGATPADYQGDWNTRAEPDGFDNVTVTASTSSGAAARSVEVRVANSGTTVEIISPAFDSVMSGFAHVVAEVANRDSDPMSSVTLTLGSLTVPMRRTSATTYESYLATNLIKDGSYTLVVKAQNGAYSTPGWTEVTVTNGWADLIAWHFGSEFKVGLGDFDYVGYNAYDLALRYSRTLAAREKTVTYTTTGERLVDLLEPGTVLSPRQLVDRVFLEGRKLGMTVARTWAFNTDVNDPHSFYAPDWTLREERFQELDYVMESARKHQTKVILALQNYWSAYGGIGAITARFGVHKLEYFTDARCKQSFKDYVAFLANRVNTVNGRRYADDPALFAWELMNEPRMDINDDETLDKHLYDPTGAKLGAWMDEMSTFIKGVDPKHMVAPGSEGHGFKGWGGSTDGYGTDPVAVMSQPNIDVYTFHPYMNEDWDRLTIGEAKALVRGFVRAGIAHGKPVVMEEYGFNKSLPVLDLLGTPVAPTSPRYGAVRGAWYRLVTATLRRERGGGSNVWNLEADAQDASYGVSFFSPASAADADRSVAAALADEATTMKAVGVTKANVWDLRQRDTDFAGFIDEVAYRRLMRLDFYGHFFNPDAATTEGEFVGILTNMGVDTASYSPSAGAPLTMDRAAQVLYSTLHLSTYGGMDEALKRVDVQPENRDGQYIASAVMQNTTTAALVIRVTDFLLYRDL